MKRFRLRKKAAEAIKLGEKLITLEDFENPGDIQDAKEGMILWLSDPEQTYTAQAIVGRQNKGFAWVFSQDTSDLWSKELVKEFLLKAIERRRSLLGDETTNAFRLFNGEGDGVGGLTIDYYKGYLQFTWYSKGAYLYRDWWLEAIGDSDLDDVQGIYETNRYSLTSGEEAISLIHGERAPQPLVIQEKGRQYAIYLGQDWMTGLFFDQREVRDFVQTQAQGLSMLNLFSYTGAFSVAAAIGGASHTVSVDVAKRSLAWTQENFKLNKISLVDGRHEIRVVDVFDYIDYAKKQGINFDLVVCDPPSFARTKNYTFSVLKDYVNLAKELFSLTAPGGFCLMATNHSAYSKEDFIQEINLANQRFKGNMQLIQTFDLPEDYPSSKDPQSHYLKVLVYYRSE
ncbi:class I SAM-dependent rRNA methyltransferase [Facklamia sp. DSM 111018]|uniref:Class I SAM-dependent rRNA methyltransferase n=1 Tax=Facklamia lactis TaxID=2749967 RepID=A0ABS0LRM6_9LACT|nr:class I SAM-dependent rRNA methyltransferase [Facklamia lactis]MBG9980810.1 class I SAM-dependent rRNA methyltransferase [Facklamia lactis]MBG9986827.1 class I SAM-dependent rRNA methyltransferase [Facklamia lactis]